MTIKDMEAGALRELLSLPAIGAPDYAADAQTQQRVGNILSAISERTHPPSSGWQGGKPPSHG